MLSWVRGRYSGWRLAEQLRSRSSSPGRGKIFPLSTSSRPILGPNLAFYPISREKEDDVKNTWMYTCLHGIMLN
jgi:hypothetical protein